MNEATFAVYKEKGLTSHDVVERVRAVSGVRKVGHAGTLDPLARGVLVIGVGRRATRQLGRLSENEKEYIGAIRLGARSNTDDAEGKITEVQGAKVASKADVLQAVCCFKGEIMQRPPKFSAVKVGGRCAYKLARADKEFELRERAVVIKEIEVVGFAWPMLEIRVVTGPGVYIRALARDIGEKLGTGGYLVELERTRVGEYRKEAALRLGDLKRVDWRFVQERQE
jgi:tRNA pseudouridine55 synthase